MKTLVSSKNLVFPSCNPVLSSSSTSLSSLSRSTFWASIITPSITVLWSFLFRSIESFVALTKTSPPLGLQFKLGYQVGREYDAVIFIKLCNGRLVLPPALHPHIRPSISVTLNPMVSTKCESLPATIDMSRLLASNLALPLASPKRCLEL